MIKKIFAAILIICLAPAFLTAGDFVNSGISDIPGVYAGSAVWGDIDNDGDIDLIVIGDARLSSGNSRIAYVYTNNSGSFTKAQELHGVYFGALALGDYNNDGYLDLAVAGLDNDDNNSLIIYKNNSGTFVEDSDQNNLVPVRYAALAWGDYNNDGNLDLVVTGMDDIGNARSIVYKNNTTTFSSVLTPDEHQTILNVNKGAVVWGDMDNDGDIDLILSGFDSDGNRTARYIKNDPVGFLRVDKSVDDSKIENLYGGNSSLALGDADADGDLDVLKAGWISGWRGSLYLMSNDGDRGFGDDMLQGSTLQKIIGSVAWCDYDNDGDLDFSAFGRDRFGALYGYIAKNNSLGSFLKDTNLSGLPALRDGAGTWGDYDNDGDLDLFICGVNSDGARVSGIYINEETASGNKPSPPTVLNTPFITNSGVAFSWGPGTDINTPEKGLTYNLRIGRTSDGNEILSAASPQGFGKTGKLTSFKLQQELSAGKYYFAVQTVDAQFMKSNFSTPREFWVETFVNSDHEVSDFLQGALDFADYDNDGYQDLIIAGRDGNGNDRAVLYDNKDGQLTENIDQAFTKFRYGDFDWGDFDNDGDLDLVYSGNYVRSNKVMGLYINGPVGTLTENSTISQTFTPVDYSSLDWGDYDNDGDLDLISIGRDDAAFSSRLYINNGDKTFTEAENLPFIGYDNGKVQWIDYDNDSDLDLFFAGQTTNDDNKARLYVNDGNGGFTELSSISFGTYISASFAWADFDSDGDFDLIITGRVSVSSNMANIKYFTNNGSGSFTENTTVSSVFSAVQGGDITIGDYDNDGDVDIIITGNQSSSATIAAYKNEGQSFSTALFRVLEDEGVDFSSSAFVDIDNDKDLDFVMMGRDKTSLQPKTRFFDNISGVNLPNEAPLPPTVINSAVNGNMATLTWNRGSDPDQYGTSAYSLTYVLRVGTTPEGNDIYSGVTQGGFGREGMALTRVIKNLTSGTYYWNVRSVDNGFAQSEWSGTGTFIIDVVKPGVASVQATPALLGIGKGTLLIEIQENFNLNHSILPTVTFSVNSSSPYPIGLISYDGKTWIGEINILSTYPSGSATISVSGVTDVSGNVMDSITGIAGFILDTQLPQVSSTIPKLNQVGISNNMNPSAVFSEDMSNIDMQDGFKLFQGNEVVSGTITYDEATRTISFIPGSGLLSSIDYQATIVSTAKDLAGNNLSGDFSWFFKTADMVSSENGGSIQNDDGSIQLYLPPNALDLDEEIPIEEVTIQGKPGDNTDEINYIGPAFRLGPADRVVSLAKKGILTLGYKNIDITGKDQAKFAIFKSNSPASSSLAWTKIGGTVSQGAKEVSVPVTSLGTFAVFEDTRTATGDAGISDIQFSPRVFSPKSTGSNLPSFTTISFKLGKPSALTIDIFNSTGRIVKRLADNTPFSNASQSIVWDGRDGDGNIGSSGLYIVKIKGEGFEELKTVAILNK